jgi:hypothetical protein
MNPDTVFLSYDEPTADAHFDRLQAVVPAARHVRGVSGLAAAYRAACQAATTEWVWIVDADNWVYDRFAAALPPSDPDPRILYTLKARNPVIGAPSAHGGIKLVHCATLLETLARHGTAGLSATSAHHHPTLARLLHAPGEPPARPFRILPLTASENRYNATPFHAWRCAFRHTAKLAHVSRSAPAGALKQALQWFTRGGDQPNGAWSMAGAVAGWRYGSAVDAAGLERINDYAWLSEQWRRAGSLGATQEAV